MLRKAALLVLLFSSGAFAQLPVQPPKPALIKAGRMLDVRTGNYLSNEGILVENGKIQEVGSLATVQAHAPKDTGVIDLSRGTVLPGLIDCHSHLLDANQAQAPGESILQTVAGMSPSEARAVGRAHGP